MATLNSAQAAQLSAGPTTAAVRDSVENDGTFEEQNKHKGMTLKLLSTGLESAGILTNVTLHVGVVLTGFKTRRVGEELPDADLLINL